METFELFRIPMTVAAVEDFATQMANLLRIATDNLTKAQEQQSRYANQKRREETFAVGNMVLLSAAHINLASQSRRPSVKLQPKYLGPYEITKTISPVAYQLNLPDDLRIHPVFHVSLLKRYTPNDSETFPGRNIPPPPPITVNDQLEYEVERLLDKRTRKFGRHQRIEYLVKWKGYPEYDATWEPIANLENAQDIIREFEEKSSTPIDEDIEF